MPPRFFVFVTIVAFAACFALAQYVADRWPQ